MGPGRRVYFGLLPLVPARSRACPLQQGQSPRGRPVTREAWGGGGRGRGQGGVGTFFSGAAAQAGTVTPPPAPTMAAAAVGQVGLRPRVGGLGNAEGSRTSGRTTRPQPVRLGATPLALGFRCKAPRKTGVGGGWGGLEKEHRALVGGGRQVISGKETGTEGLRREIWRR